MTRKNGLVYHFYLRLFDVDVEKPRWLKSTPSHNQNQGHDLDFINQLHT